MIPTYLYVSGNIHIFNDLARSTIAEFSYVPNFLPRLRCRVFVPHGLTITETILMPVTTSLPPSYERSKRTPIDHLVDLDRYPIHDLDSDSGRDLVSNCQRSLADTAGALLPDFVRPDALSKMATEAERLASLGPSFSAQLNPAR